MTFTCTLKQAIDVSSTLAVNGYEIDEYVGGTANGKDAVRLCCGEDEIGIFPLHIPLEIDSDGVALVRQDGYTYEFEFRVSRPLTKGDLL